MENFLDKCFTIDFDDSCYLGYMFLTVGVFLFLLNLYGLIKMTLYYRKLNFENGIILLSVIQSIFLLIQMIFSFYLLISIFFFIQILLMCLINKKFREISTIGNVTIKCNYLTEAIIIINIVYLIGYNTYYLIDDSTKLFHLNIFYYLLQIFSAFFLAYHCRIFVHWIECENLKKQKTPQYIKQTTSKFIENTNVGAGLFYSIKKTQLSLLYLSNLIFSFLELIFDIILTYKGGSTASIYYIYILLFFIHNIIIFISFYWIIRDQYNRNQDKVITDKDEKTQTLIDENYIKEEQASIKDENKRIQKYMNANSEAINANNEKNSGKGVFRKFSNNETFSDNLDCFNSKNINIEELPSNTTSN